MFTVRVQPRALAEIEAIHRYIGEKASLAAADHWYDGFIEALISLESIPTRCPRAPENDRFKDEVRHRIEGDYRALFTIRGNTVYIIRVLGRGQDWAQPD